MKTDFETIVLGLGGIGAAAAYWLARRYGNNVLGLEQFEIGHVRGGSQDHSRIIRLSYHTPGYVELAKLAYQAWASLEQDADEALIIKTGGLDLWPANPAIPMRDYSESLRACNVPYEMLDAREIMRRWPQWKLTQDVVGIFQAESGIAPAARCNAAHLRMARAHGATLIDQQPIVNIRSVAGEYEVVTAQGTYRCARLVMAAGAWSNQAYRSFGVQLPLTVTQEQVTYFTPLAPNHFTPERFPIWIWMDEPSFYGFPIYGEQAIKVAQDVGGQEVTGHTRSFEPDEANLQRVMNFMRKYLPSGIGPIAYTKTCLYTLTPDRDFVIDSLPEHSHVATAIGAGHAFKFASLIGKLLAEIVSDQPISADLTPFRFNRPILLEKEPQKHFLV
ncbi:MAG: N-methyl-L-tryptophan oxidase [Caldilineaceae bacterium]